MKRIMLLTGRPGIGKTSVLLRTVKELKSKGFKIGGMISREVREHGLRVGFEILDLATSRKGWLAHVKQTSGPKVGKYRVNLKDLNSVGALSIEEAVRSSDVIIIDEIGPMELYSPEFKRAVNNAVNSSKPVLGTIHWRAKDMLINALKSRKDVEVLEVTFENRETLHKLIMERLIQLLQKSEGFSHAYRRS